MNLEERSYKNLLTAARVALRKEGRKSSIAKTGIQPTDIASLAWLAMKRRDVDFNCASFQLMLTFCSFQLKAVLSKNDVSHSKEPQVKATIEAEASGTDLSSANIERLREAALEAKRLPVRRAAQRALSFLSGEQYENDWRKWTDASLLRKHFKSAAA